MKVNLGIGILAAVSLLGVSLSAAQAQEPAASKSSKPGQKGHGRMGGGIMRNPKIAKELGLTEDQQKKIKEIMETTKTKRAAIRDDKALTEDQKKDKLRELGKEANASFEKVLTPEQNAKVKEMKKKIVESRMAKGGKVGVKP